MGTSVDYFRWGKSKPMRQYSVSACMPYNIVVSCFEATFHAKHSVRLFPGGWSRANFRTNAKIQHHFISPVDRAILHCMDCKRSFAVCLASGHFFQPQENIQNLVRF